MSKAKRIFMTMLALILLFYMLPIHSYAHSIDDTDITTEPAEEHSDVENNAVLTASDTTFLPSKGGTLILDYTGELSPVSNTIYKKVIYFTADELVYYQAAMNSENYLDYIDDELISAGITLITPAIAAKLGKALSIKESICVFLVGQTLSSLVWALQNLEAWNLEDAIERCEGTPKVKLEFIKYTSSVDYPSYYEAQHFEPWNSNYIEIPENYDYKWFEGIYDYDSSVHTHYWDEYISISNSKHKKVCGLCDAVETESCDLSTYIYNNNGTHDRVCKLCGYCRITQNCSDFTEYVSGENGTHYRNCGICDGALIESCTYSGFESYNTTKHMAVCSICDYTYYETHAWNATKTLCLVCGFDLSGPSVAAALWDNQIYVLQ